MKRRTGARLVLVAAITAGTVFWWVRDHPSAPQRPISIGPVITGSCNHRCPDPTALASAPSPAITCSAPAQTDGWPTDGHDPQRTGAGAGCIGLLHTVWRYVPTPVDGRKLEMVFHAIGDAGGLYLEWAESDTSGDWFEHFVGTTAIDGIDAQGNHRWTFDSGRDVGLGNWPVLGFGKVGINDDAIVWMDQRTGEAAGDPHSVSGSNDLFGQLIVDPANKRWYAANEVHLHRDGLSLQAGSTTVNGFWVSQGGPNVPVWTVNRRDGTCYNDMADQTGGMALDAGTLFYAPHYNGHTDLKSGVYAVAATTGGQRWFVPGTPQSRISAGSGMVFLVDGSTLTALRQSDGAVSWTVPLHSPSAQAPVIADGLVIAADGDGVHAHDLTTGHLRWTTPMSGAAVSLTTLDFGADCASGVLVGSNRTVQAAAPSNSLVAATGSGTVLVAATGGLHVLSLTSGQELWSGMVAGQRGPLRDPILVGNTVYAVDSDGVLALASG